MSTYKPKGSSLYYFEFVFKGVRHYGSTGTARKAEAEEVEATEREKARRAHFFPDESKKKPQMTLKAAFDRYFIEVSDHLASADNHLTYMAKLLSLGADKNLSDITDSDIALLVARRRGEKARYSLEPVSNATVNRETQLLSRIFRRAKRAWKVDVGDIDWPLHILHEADERVRELTAAEEAALFAELRSDFHPMVRFALLAGMRLGNVIRLTWKQVDMISRQITVKVKSRKPGGRSHTLPISPGMLALLANERGNHPIFVFTYLCKKSRQKRKRGERYPFSQNGWRKPWTEALTAAGIEDFRFHDTRHTAATRIVRKTGNIKIAQKLLGHASISSTTRYAHVTQDDVMAALIGVESQENPKVDQNVDQEKTKSA